MGADNVEKKGEWTHGKRIKWLQDIGEGGRHFEGPGDNTHHGQNAALIERDEVILQNGAKYTGQWLNERREG